MDALTLLHDRASVPAAELGEPAPDDHALWQILRAGTSAPDHGGLRPWRFIVIRGEARSRLGDLFAEALSAREPSTSAEQIERQRAKPMRSPLIVAVAAVIDPDHPKVPETEQVLSAGVAAEHLALAARALGFGAVWLTGAPAYDGRVSEGLGLAPEDRIVGFLYMGTPAQGHPARERPDPGAFTRYWTEPVALETL